MTTAAGTRRTAAGRASELAPLRPRRRSWALAVTGVLVVAVCALVFAAGWLRAGNRQPVLALARNVAAGQLLSASDLQVVRVSVAGPVSLVPVAQEATVVGRPAAGPLPAGAVLTPADVGQAGPAAGQADLGVAVKAGQYPPDLSPGQTVDVLATPAAASDASTQSTSAPALPVGQAVVLGVSVNAGSGATVVELALSQNAVPQVAAAAAAGQIALATIPSER
jgi:hypothetical protein